MVMLARYWRSALLVREVRTVASRRCKLGLLIRLLAKFILTTRGSAVTVHGNVATHATRVQCRRRGMILASSGKASEVRVLGEVLW